MVTLTLRQKTLIYSALKEQSDSKDVSEDKGLFKETVELQQAIYNADEVILS